MNLDYSSWKSNGNTKSKPTTTRDTRRIHIPVEISLPFPARHPKINTETNRLVLTSEKLHRSHTILDHEYTADTSSYFPKINESYITREYREHRARQMTGRSFCHQSLLPSNINDQKQLVKSETSESQLSSTGVTALLMKLDCEGMEQLHESFKDLHQMDQEEFISEMLLALKAEKLHENEQLRLTGTLIDIFIQMDVRNEELVDWDDFTGFLSRSSDMALTLDDQLINKYQSDVTPPHVHLASAVHNMFYFPAVDKVALYDGSGKGFQLYNVNTGNIQKTLQQDTRGQVVDILYSSRGRYVITASTSPVISFYDVDELRLRQQIPTENAQTALALQSANSPLLYSASTTGLVSSWDLETLQCTQTYKLHPSTSVIITDLELIHTSNHLACASLDSTIYMLDVESSKMTRKLQGHRKGIIILRYCEENGYLLSGGLDHCVQVWNPHLKQKIGSLLGHRSQLIGLEIRPNTPEVVTADTSGVVKIWDLRKFTCVQTIVKEQYIREHAVSKGIARRPLTSMCYISSHQRIAMAHSTMFFLDPQHSVHDKHTQDPATKYDEAIKAIGVLYHPPSQCFMVCCPWVLQWWEVSTGQLARTTPLNIGVEITCVKVMHNHHSCVVGCDNGTIVRLMLPDASIVAQERLHEVEITAINCVHSLQYVVSSAIDGSIVVSQWDTFENVYILNHWRGVQSVHNYNSSLNSDKADTLADYSMPLHLRSFFYQNEIERFKRVFGESDPLRHGAIPLSKLSFVLERAFPSSNATQTHQSTVQGEDSDQILTFSMFMEVMKDVFIQNQTSKHGLASVSSIDIHEQLLSMISASSTDGTYCMWNLKNGTVMAQGTTIVPAQLSHVCFLTPFSYFVCIEEQSAHCSIWSSISLPPLCSHPQQCLVRFTHLTTFASGSFLTETLSTSEERAIRSIDWFNDEETKLHLLCVGDEQGGLAIYDVSGLLMKIHKAKQQIAGCMGMASGSHGHVNQSQEALFPKSIQQRHQWTAYTRTAIQQVRFSKIDNLMDSMQVLVVSVSDNAMVNLWTMEGELLGCLGTTKVPWKLKMNMEDLKQEHDEQTAHLLQQAEQRRSVHESIFNGNARPETVSYVDFITEIRRPMTTSCISSQLLTSSSRSSPRISRILTTEKPKGRSVGPPPEDALVARLRPKLRSRSVFLSKGLK